MQAVQCIGVGILCLKYTKMLITLQLEIIANVAGETSIHAILKEFRVSKYTNVYVSVFCTIDMVRWICIS